MQCDTDGAWRDARDKDRPCKEQVESGKLEELCETSGGGSGVAVGGGEGAGGRGVGGFTLKQALAGCDIKVPEEETCRQATCKAADARAATRQTVGAGMAAQQPQCCSSRRV